MQCHSWGATMTAAFENMAPCMFNYMTDLGKVEEDPEETVEMKVEGKLTHRLAWYWSAW